MHVWPFLLSVLSVYVTERAQCCLLSLLSACLALFTGHAQCRFGHLYCGCYWPSLLTMLCAGLALSLHEPVLSACWALFTERAQCMFGPVY